MRLVPVLLVLLGVAACTQGGDAAAPNSVVRWVDGDTVEVTGASGEPVTIRLEGVDTPEFRSYGGRNECVDRDVAARAAARAADLAPPGTPVTLTVLGADRYGRILALVATKDGDVGDRLVDDGLARLWPDGRCPT